MKKKILLVGILVVVFVCATMFADTIYLNNGNKVTGKVVTQDTDRVVLRIGEGEDATEVTFFSDEIQRIETIEETATVATESSSSENKSKESLAEPAQPVTISQPAVPPIDETPSLEKPLENIGVGTTQAGETTLLKIETQPTQLQLESTATQTQTQLQSAAETDQQDTVAKEQKILEQLTALLDKQELDYFMKIESMAKDVVNKTMQVLVDPQSLTQDPTQLVQMMQDLSLDIANIVTQLNSIQPPSLFVNFHKYYLGNLNLLKEMLTEMSKADVAASQTKIKDLQEANIKIQEELNKILQEKKTKQPSQNANPSA